MQDTNLNELLNRVSLADRKAFQQLYQNSSSKLYAIAIRITRDAKLAEDTLQEGFVNIWHNANRFDPQKAQAITWMGSIVRNQAIDLIRKNQRHTDHAPLEDDILSEVDDLIEDEIVKTADHELLHSCLQKLDNKYREAILLAYLEGYTHKEIAEKQALSISNVKNRIHRGVAMVKNCVQRHLGQPI